MRAWRRKLPAVLLCLAVIGVAAPGFAQPPEMLDRLPLTGTVGAAWRVMVQAWYQVEEWLSPSSPTAIRGEVGTSGIDWTAVESGACEVDCTGQSVSIDPDG